MPVCSKCQRMLPSAEITRGRCRDKARCEHVKREATLVASMLKHTQPVPPGRFVG